MFDRSGADPLRGYGLSLAVATLAAFLVATAMLALAFIMTLAAIKAYNYPMWLGMPLVAGLTLCLCALLKLQTMPARLVASVLLTPMVLSTAAVGLAQAAGSHATIKAQRRIIAPASEPQIMPRWRAFRQASLPATSISVRSCWRSRRIRCWQRPIIVCRAGSSLLIAHWPRRRMKHATRSRAGMRHTS